jgi:pimeloyl-ACP methyl ester carboxylesterase
VLRHRLGALIFFLASSGCTYMVPADNWFHPGRVDLSLENRSNPSLPAGYTIRDLPFAAADGTALHALLVSAPSSRGTVLYFGGDSFHVGTGGLPVARFFASLDLSVLLVDYRGYGLSEGTPTIPALKSDAIRAFDLASSLASPSTPLVVHGFSMGSFIAASLTEQRPVRALVLESTAPSALAWARHQIPWIAKPFVRVSLAEPLPAESNEGRLRLYHGYLLLLAGSADRITPPSMARDLLSISASSPAKKRLFVSPGAGHGAVLFASSTAAEYERFFSLVSSLAP